MAHIARGTSVVRCDRYRRQHRAVGGLGGRAYVGYRFGIAAGAVLFAAQFLGPMLLQLLIPPLRSVDKGLHILSVPAVPGLYFALLRSIDLL